MADRLRPLDDLAVAPASGRSRLLLQRLRRRGGPVNGVLDVARQPWMAIAAFMVAFVALLGGLQSMFAAVRRLTRSYPRRLLHAGSGLLTLSFPVPLRRPVAGPAADGRQRRSSSLPSSFSVPLREPLGGVVDGVADDARASSTFRSRSRSLFWLAHGKSPLLFVHPGPRAHPRRRDRARSSASGTGMPRYSRRQQERSKDRSRSRSSLSSASSAAAVVGRVGRVESLLIAPTWRCS